MDVKSVLLIVPCWVLREAITRSLPDNFEILTCYSITEGSQLSDQRPDALILDISALGLDGLIFLRENLLELPPMTIVLTSYIDAELLKDLERLGASHVILKPCTADSITRHIQRYQ